MDIVPLAWEDAYKPSPLPPPPPSPGGDDGGVAEMGRTGLEITSQRLHLTSQQVHNATV